MFFQPFSLLSSFSHLLIFLASISALIFIAIDSTENVLLGDPVIQVHFHNHYQPNFSLSLFLFFFLFSSSKRSFSLVPGLHSVAWVEK